MFGVFCSRAHCGAGRSALSARRHRAADHLPPIGLTALAWVGARRPRACGPSRLGARGPAPTTRRRAPRAGRVRAPGLLAGARPALPARPHRRRRRSAALRRRAGPAAGASCAGRLVGLGRRAGALPRPPGDRRARATRCGAWCSTPCSTSAAGAASRSRRRPDAPRRASCSGPASSTPVRLAAARLLDAPQQLTRLVLRCCSLAVVPCSSWRARLRAPATGRRPGPRAARRGAVQRRAPARRPCSGPTPPTSPGSSCVPLGFLPVAVSSCSRRAPRLDVRRAALVARRRRAGRARAARSRTSPARSYADYVVADRSASTGSPTRSSHDGRIFYYGRADVRGRAARAVAPTSTRDASPGDRLLVGHERPAQDALQRRVPLLPAPRARAGDLLHRDGPGRGQRRRFRGWPTTSPRPTS